MTVTELRAYIKNIYAATAALETAGNLPAGEGVVVARLILGKALDHEAIEVVKV